MAADRRPLTVGLVRAVFVLPQTLVNTVTTGWKRSS